MNQQDPGLSFDPGAAAFARDPHARYAALRAHAEPVFHAGLNSWLLSRYADVDLAARDPRLVRGMDSFMTPAEVAEHRRAAGWDQMPDHERLVQTNLLESDGPTHQRLRMLIIGEFTRARVARHRAMIENHVNRLLDELLEVRAFDFIADFAARVPGHIIGNLLGVPDEDCPQLRIWSEQVVQFFDVDRTDAHKRLAERATTEFELYLQDLIRLRRRAPRDDLLSMLIRAQDEGQIDANELVATSMLILMAGHGSTIDVLGTGMLALLTHPEQMQLLREQPRHFETAVPEMFRHESPLPFFHRFARESLHLFGRRWAPGTRFGLLYGAANRDPEAFVDADRFDVTRRPNRHIAFGRGAHLCLGNQLSRLDVEIVFRTLLGRTRAVTAAGPEPEFKRGLSVRGLAALPVALTPA